ncbi:hypothetical protein DICVIV_00519 [Dictyocaulus viviparus]|uniref:Uncharacterized protein n=1 Tax=Dictyocaulus viviparus TaxID=29172 RepID=A0A0D8Y8R4_DICVI|nr:hypothetical protein DICVIV_00519 [Dictyocaulus viviparus]
MLRQKYFTYELTPQASIVDHRHGHRKGKKKLVQINTCMSSECWHWNAYSAIKMERGIQKNNTNDKLNSARTDPFRRPRAGINHIPTASSVGTVVETVKTNEEWMENGNLLVLSQINRVVTERKCGVVDDVTGCTLYNSKITRKVRHLLSEDHSSVRRETSTLFVEISMQRIMSGRRMFQCCIKNANNHRIRYSPAIVTITVKHVESDAAVSSNIA